MITLGTGDYIAGVASVASKLAITIVGGLELGTAEDYKTLFNGFLPNAAASQYAAPASKSALIRSITVVNTDSSSRTFQLFRGGTTAQFAITGTVTLPVGYFAIWDGSGFAVFSDQGQRLGVGAAGADGTPGTSDHDALANVSAEDHHAAPVAGPDANITVDAAGAAGTAGAFARSAHGHQVATTDAPSGANVTIDAAPSAAATGAIARAAHGHRANTYSSTPAAPTVAGSAGASGTAPARGDHAHPVPTPVRLVHQGSTTFAKATYAGALYVEVEVVGSGGGSGGCATTGAGQRAASGGGGGGGYARKIFALSALGTTETVTIGAAGLAGTAGDNDGGAGGTCSFGAAGTLVQATGGGGGEGAALSGAPATPNLGGTGGVGSGGDLNAYGDDGGNSGQPGAAGQSSGSAYGGGTALGGIRRGSSQPEAPAAGHVYGGGASGGTIVASTTQIAGAAGALGVVIITVHY